MDEFSKRKPNNIFTFAPIVLGSINFLVVAIFFVNGYVLERADFNIRLVNNILFIPVAFITLGLSILVFYKSIKMIIRISKEKKDEKIKNVKLSNQIITANLVMFLLTTIPFGIDLAFLLMLIV